jgi:hypothetical protein
MALASLMACLGLAFNIGKHAYRKPDGLRACGLAK